jgi:hypothetical protein
VLDARADAPSLLELEIAQGKRRLIDPDVIQYFSTLPGSEAGGVLPVCAITHACALYLY